jgi:hypothetical protein
MALKTRRICVDFAVSPIHPHTRHSLEHGNPSLDCYPWIPACARMGAGGNSSLMGLILRHSEPTPCHVDRLFSAVNKALLCTLAPSSGWFIGTGNKICDPSSQNSNER